METRQYPQACQSKNCGKTSCPKGCGSLPELMNVVGWINEHAAIRRDPIFAPNTYTATK